MKSALPYRVNEDGGTVYSPNGDCVASCAPNAGPLAFPQDAAVCRANAAAIAQACNIHDELVELARQYGGECGECAGTGITPDDLDCPECKFIRDVLAKIAP